MAKKSMWAREAKRAKIVAQYATKRAELKAIINDRSKSHEEIDAAVVALQKLPRDASPARQRAAAGFPVGRTVYTANSACAGTSCVKPLCAGMCRG